MLLPLRLRPLVAVDPSQRSPRGLTRLLAELHPDVRPRRLHRGHRTEGGRVAADGGEQVGQGTCVHDLVLERNAHRPPELTEGSS